MQAGRRPVIGPAISPPSTCASTRVTAPSGFARKRRPPGTPAATGERALGFPLPAGELFAKGDLLELADAGPRNRFHEHEGFWHLPTGDRPAQELAQILFGCAGAVF